MKENSIEIICILDRSGSMHSIKMDAIGGFNTFIEDQKKVEGEAKVSVYIFDDVYEILYEEQDIQNAPLLNTENFVPRGGTALHDAIGRTINSVGERLAKTPEEERPENVLFLIITDGGENMSREFSGNKIKEMIEHQEEKYSWDFTFIGANQDAALVGGLLGIKSHKTMSFAATSDGTNDMMSTLSSYTTSYRCADKLSKSSLVLDEDK